MSECGTCDQGCSENRLELVAVPELDTIVALGSDAAVRVSAYRTVTEELATSRSDQADYEIAYRSVQNTARAVLGRYPAHKQSPDPDEPDRSTTWWCSACGGIDAPQPCLGICIWRRLDWVNAQLYERERARALAQRDAEIELRAFLKRLASITPRGRHWKLGWQTLQAAAQQSLRNAPVLAVSHAPAATTKTTNSSAAEHTSRPASIHSH